MTHEYTLLVGGTVIVGGAEPDCEAIAWADDTILALGSEAEVRAISRGDSHVVEIPGAFVRGARAERLEVGDVADLEVRDADPRGVPAGGLGDPRAVIRAGRVIAGELHLHG
jgi:predicted amidohydrolase YtcJ